jgi:hypothetical protein
MSVFALSSLALSQEANPEEPPPTASPEASSPQEDTPTEAAEREENEPSPPSPVEEEKDASKEKDSFREQTIYIPYEDLRKTFEKEDRGVFLPYPQFRKLWDAARATEVTPPPDAPPVGAMITETENVATVSEDIVQVRAKVNIELLTDGWHEIPLWLSDAAVTSATIDGQPARLLGGVGQGYRLLIEKKPSENQRILLEIEYAKSIERAPGRNHVSFEAPRAPVSRWKVIIPEEGVNVDFFPLIAATEAQSAENEEDPPSDVEGEENAPAEDDPSDGQTVVMAFVGSAPTVRIGWTPKSEGATGMEALASLRLEQRVQLEEGVLRTQANLQYTISRSEIARLAVEVPEDQKVVGVFDPNVRQWSVDRGEGHQTINIELFEPSKKNQTLMVEMEKFLGKESDSTSEEAPSEPSSLKGGPPSKISIPQIRGLGVARQQGVLVLQVAEELAAETTRTSGLLQLDREDLPDSLKNQNWNFAYRFASAAYQLEVAIEKVRPRIHTESQVKFTLSPLYMRLDMMATYHIERAGVFQVSCLVPADYALLSVSGYTAENVKPMQIESHHLDPVQTTSDDRNDAPKMRKLTINLSRKAIGTCGLQLRLHKRLREPDLLSPTGSAVSLDLTAPRVDPESVQRREGNLLILAEDCFRVNPTQIEGLRAVPREQLPETLRVQQWNGTLLSYAFGQEPLSLAISVQRRQPHVTLRQLLHVQIEDGVVQYEDRIHYDILYSGIKTLRIDVPESISGKLRNKTQNQKQKIRDTILDPQPDDVPEGYVAWGFSGETELQGAGRIDLVWEEELTQLQVGRSVNLQIPRLIPRDCDRSWGQIVLSKVETIDLYESETMEGVRPIDPQHDIAGGDTFDDAARAFEFHDDWKLAVVATRYQLEEVKRTSIERALLQAVVTRAETISVQALYRIRSVRQRLILEMPEGAEFQTEPKINGLDVPLESEPSDGKARYLIPLTQTEPDTPLLLELRYHQPTERGTIGYPTFPLEPAIQQVFMAVYLPEERALLHFGGPWSRHFQQWLRGSELAVENDPTVDDRLHWVTELPDQQARGFVTDFPVDGRPYLFSSRGDNSVDLFHRNARRILDDQ